MASSDVLVHSRISWSQTLLSNQAHGCALQADFTVRELVRALAKVVLLYAPLMGNASPGGPSGTLMVGSTWGPAWRALLDCLVQGMAQVRLSVLLPLGHS